MKTMLTDDRKHMRTAVVASCLALVALVLMTLGAHAQTVSYNPFVVQGIIDQTGTTGGSTLLPVEFNGTGVARFDVGNTGSSDLLLVTNQEMKLVITLSKGVPNVANPSDPVAALAALGGDGVAWFDWTYEPAITTYRATQKATIPGSTPTVPSRRTITIQYRVTQNSFLGGSPATSNGFNVNVSPPPYTNPQPTNDDAVSSYTYVQARDYGDVPLSYGAAVHTIDVAKDVSTGLYNRYMYLGPAVDPETAYQASTDAKGDDINKTAGLGVNDESGVSFPKMTAGQTVNIQVTVTVWDWDPNGTNWGATAVFLRGWIDWPRDNTFSTGTPDRVVNYDFKTLILDNEDAWTGPRSFTLTFPVAVPSGASGQYYACFRLGPANNPTAAADYGEVEDYRISTDAPTAVLLDNFQAVAQPDHVLVTWETVSEVSNAGFNLYRALTVDGERTLLASEPSKAPGGTAGAEYSYKDFDVQSGQTYWYYLEDLDLSGEATLHEPVSVEFPVALAVTLRTLGATTGSGPALWLVVLAGLVLSAAPLALALRRRMSS